MKYALHELPPDRFDRVLGLYDDSECLSVEPWSVIERSNPGRVFVDSRDRPATALVWSPGMEGFYLLGDETNRALAGDLAGFLTEVMAPTVRAFGYDAYELSGLTTRWDPVIQASFADRELTSWRQSVYLLPPGGQAPPEPSVPDGFALLRASEVLERGLPDDSLLRRLVGLYWGTAGAFLSRGFGYCAVRRGHVASVCIVACRVARAHDACCLGIETVERHRQRGLGRAVAAACVRQVLARQARPYWDCEVANTVSAATARSVGLRETWQYNCYAFPL